MADISYTRTTWADGSDGGTPIDAAKLNNIEQGVVDAVAAIGPNDTTEDGTLKAQIDQNASDISDLQDSVYPSLTTNVWSICFKAEGMGATAMFPCMKQPNSVTCTNTEIYNHGWKSITFSDWRWGANMLYLGFDPGSSYISDNQNRLIRMNLTVS